MMKQSLFTDATALPLHGGMATTVTVPVSAAEAARSPLLLSSSTTNVIDVKTETVPGSIGAESRIAPRLQDATLLKDAVRVRIVGNLVSAYSTTSESELLACGLSADELEYLQLRSAGVEPVKNGSLRH